MKDIKKRRKKENHSQKAKKVESNKKTKAIGRWLISFDRNRSTGKGFCVNDGTIANGVRVPWRLLLLLGM